MWTLAQPSVDLLDEQLTNALTYANGQPVYPLSLVERQAIHATYQLYDALSGEASATLKPVALDACRSAMMTAYGQVQIGGRLVSLRSALLASTGVCPYCGFGEVTQLDHYLPISEYGELAIYPRNLVPSCGPCNNAKRAIVAGGAIAGFIHTYFEPLPDATFLHADIAFVDGTLDVTFRILPGLVSGAVEAKLTCQLERLKLNARYPSQINKFLSEQRLAITMVSQGLVGSLILAKFLDRSAAAMAVTFGRNDWRPALLRALALNGEFCDQPELYFGERVLAPEE
ncbi:MAG: HNH endonuclease signature motif containing protein [Novosphingobium sp.]